MKRVQLQKLLEAFQKTGDASPIYALFDALDTHDDPSPTCKETLVHKSPNSTLKIDTPSSIFEEDMHTIDHQMMPKEESFAAQHQSILPSLSSEYEKEEMIGKGGMGVVWRVRDSNLNRTMALKMLHEHYAVDSTVQEEFIEEAQISAQLQHPGIVPVYELNHLPNGQLFFTMKEVRGRTLKEVIKTVHQASHDGTWRSAQDGWNLRRLIHAFHMICETIAYAHSRGVIHRDLKPSNIMIGDFGEVLVVDWGIAKIISLEGYSMPKEEYVVTNRSRLGISESEGTVLGSPAYMSPEQAWGDIDLLRETSDIYSLGMILCEILLGEVPYKGSVHDILEYKRQAHTLSLRGISTQEKEKLRKDKKDFDFLDKHTKMMALDPSLPLPNELIEICEKALQYEAHMRYQHVVELANEVQSWLNGAQRREKALSIVDKAKDIETQIAQQQAAHFSAWKKADAYINESLESSEGWTLWDESKKLQESKEEQEEEMVHLLQGAMMYDPELIDIHRRLVQIEYKGFLEAALRGDRKIKRKIQRRISIHLENLSKEEAVYWLEREKKDLDSLHVLQKRRGSFVGRQVQKAELCECIQSHRIVSLVGTAGVGKTHLTLEVASQWKTEQHDVLFCDITTANNALCIVQILAESLHLDIYTENPLEQIEVVLRERGRSLLIFDNTEHLVRITSHLIKRLLENVPQLHIMVTSRVKLGLPQETTYTLHPMSVLEGIELFVQRAQRIQPEFLLSPQNRVTVGTIVKRLDQLPLAIELAASRISMLSVEDIAVRLSQRFELLRGRIRNPHQMALQGALDWSWGLLSKIEQSALVQCGIFHGGFDLIAAESILEFQNSEEPISVIDILEALYDDHLIVKTRQESGRFRYGMLASIREYVLQKCALSEHRYIQNTKHRHAHYYGQLSRRAKNNPSLPIDRDLDNLVFGVTSGRPNDAFLCCQGFLDHILLHGPMDRGIELSNMFLGRNDIHADLRAPIQLHRITCLRIAGKVEQAKKEIAALEANRQEEKKRATKRSTVAIPAAGQTEQKSTKMETKLSSERDVIEKEQATYKQAIQEFSNLLVQYRSQNNQIEEANILQEMGRVHREEGYFDISMQCYKDALHLCVRTGNKKTKGSVLGEMGVLFSKLGNIQKSEEHYRQSFELTREVGDEKQEGITLGNLGTLYLQMCQNDKAIRYFEQSITIAKKVKNKRGEGISLGNLGVVLYEIDAYEQAKERLQQAIKICLEHMKIGAGTFQGVLALIYAKEENFKIAFELLADGERHVSGNPEEYGKFLCAKAEVLFLDHQEEASKEALRQAGTIQQELRLHETSELHQKIEHIRRMYLASSRSTEANIFLERGNLELEQSNYDRATPLFQKALQSFRQHKDAIGEVAALQGIGRIHRERGEYQKSLHEYQKALIIAQKLKNQREEGKILGDLGNVSFNMSKFETSAQYYHKAIYIAQEIGDKRTEGIHIGNLGSVHKETGQYQEAISAFQRSIQLAQEIGDKRTEGLMTSDLGTLYRYMGEYEKSISYYKTALSITQARGDRRSEGIINGNLGVVYKNQDRYEEAIAVLTTSWSIAREIGDQRNESMCLNNLGIIYKSLAQYDKAVECYVQSNEISIRIHDRSGEALGIANLANIYQLQERYEEAIVNYQKTLNIFHETGHQKNKGVILGNLGDLLSQQNRTEEAKDHLQQAIALCDETMPPGAGVFRGSLALIYAKEQRYEEAFALLKQGEPQVMVYKKEYGKFLCKKAEVFLISGHINKAGDILVQAQNTISKIVEGSILANMIQAVQEKISAAKDRSSG